MIKNNEVALIIGIRGSGKSTLTKYFSDTFDRVIIFDRLKEHQDEHVISNLAQFQSYWHKFHEQESFKFIVQLSSAKNDELFQSEVNEILNIIYETGFRKNRAGIPQNTTLLVFEELQFFCTPYSIIPSLKECILTGRHANITLIANTQRPANIHGDFKGNAHHLFAGQLIHKSDVNYLKESILGDDATKCLTIQKYHFLYKSHDHPLTIVII